MSLAYISKTQIINMYGFISLQLGNFILLMITSYLIKG